MRESFLDAKRTIYLITFPRQGRNVRPRIGRPSKIQKSQRVLEDARSKQHEATNASYSELHSKRIPANTDTIHEAFNGSAAVLRTSITIQKIHCHRTCRDSVSRL